MTFPAQRPDRVRNQILKHLKLLGDSLRIPGQSEHQSLSLGPSPAPAQIAV
jgi:hypothetical protein